MLYDVLSRSISIHFLKRIRSLADAALGLGLLWVWVKACHLCNMSFNTASLPLWLPTAERQGAE